MLARKSKLKTKRLRLLDRPPSHPLRQRVRSELFYKVTETFRHGPYSSDEVAILVGLLELAYDTGFDAARIPKAQWSLADWRAWRRIEIDAFISFLVEVSRLGKNDMETVVHMMAWARDKARAEIGRRY